MTIRILLLSILVHTIKADSIPLALVSICTAGTRCYPENNGGCRRDEGELSYCIIGGPLQPDPQIGYLGPCGASVYTNNICVDCLSGSICTYQTGLSIDTTTKFAYTSPGWLKCEGPMSYPNAGTQCIYMTPCMFGFDTSDDDWTAYKYSTPQQMASATDPNHMYYCMASTDTYPAIDVQAASMGTGYYTGPCSYGLFCSNDMHNWCVMDYEYVDTSVPTLLHHVISAHGRKKTKAAGIHNDIEYVYHYSNNVGVINISNGTDITERLSEELTINVNISKIYKIEKIDIINMTQIKITYL